jgi:hypothetical protein
MTLIQIQVPVTRFSVEYEVGASRPYSVFERLLLRAIDGGIADVDSLSALLAVPARLVVEGVVTLIHAGWVGLGSDNNVLLTTASGRQAAESGEPPTTMESQRPFPLHVAMERVTGSYSRNSDVQLVRDRDLDEPDGKLVVRLPAQIHDNRIDTGDVRPLLKVDPGQWVRWISPDSQLVSKGSQSAIGLYDRGSGRLTNLPDAFRAAIEPLLVARLGGPTSTYIPKAALPASTRRCRIQLDAADLVVNSGEHQAILQKALGEASAHFLACSAFLRRSVLEELAPSIGEALDRGVAVDLLWGYGGRPEEVADALEFVKKLQYDYRNSAGTLTCNDAPSGSHAKVLLWDAAGSAVNACVGSYNWLSAGGGPMGELSTWIRHPSLVADLARFAADRWSDVPGSRLDVAQRRWHQLAADWEQLWNDTDEPEAGVIASLVFGRAHEAALRRAVVDSSPGVFVVLSHRVAAVGLRRLDDGRAIERSPFSGVLVAGEILDDVAADQVQQTADILGMRYFHRPVHAKVLIHGDSVLIGSYNYLSADPPSHGGRARELSLRLDGVTSRKLVQKRLPEIWRPTS